MNSATKCNNCGGFYKNYNDHFCHGMVPDFVFANVYRCHDGIQFGNIYRTKEGAEKQQRAWQGDLIGTVKLVTQLGLSDSDGKDNS